MAVTTEAAARMVTDLARPHVEEIDVREYLERWARWRNGGSPIVSRWPASASGGQYLSGRGSRTCPTCDGDGRMPGKLVGSSEKYLHERCPQCDGEKRVAGDLEIINRAREIDCVYCARHDERSGRTVSTGELPDGRTCHKCHGGRRMVVVLRIHPATVKGTRYFGANEDPDPTSALIDRTVAGWIHGDGTFWFARVLLAEYTWSGSQEMKAKQLGPSFSFYRNTLCKAHKMIADVIKTAN